MRRDRRAFVLVRRFCLLALLAPFLAAAQEGFVVDDIRLEGLQQLVQQFILDLKKATGKLLK